MKTLVPQKCARLLIASFLLPAAVTAGTITPWPATQPYSWNTTPFAPVCGTVSVVPPDVLQMSGFGSGSKNATWLPYNVLDSGYAERLCVARFVFSTPVTNVHARVFDPSVTGADGWAIILKDSTGRILDFGLRTYFANKQITAHQYDGVTWVNRYFFDRARTGNDYYSMNFTNNSDGTITWSLESMIWDSVNGVFNYYTNSENTTVSYGEITEVYLNAMAKTTTSANYKWTEFSVNPPVMSPPPLHIAPASPTDVALWWPSPWTTSFVVHTNADLGGTSWGPVTNTPTDDGINITVTLPMAPGNQFFRLQN